MLLIELCKYREKLFIVDQQLKELFNIHDEHLDVSVVVMELVGFQ
jgi:hypothetical protein